LRAERREREGLAHRLELLLRRLYGQRSEKIDPNQLLLFEDAFDKPEPADEADANSDEAAPPETPAPRKTGSKRNGRRTLPANLPRVRKEHDLAEAEKLCPCCGEALAPIGEETSEQLDYKPASLFVWLHVRKKYACKACEEHVKTAGKPPQPIDKGLPGSGLLAHVATSKYAEHCPLHRQESMLARHGVEISRKTLCDWMARVGELLSPIVAAMRRRVLQSQVIQTDDTTVPVRDPRQPGKTKTGRLWTYLGDRHHPYTLFDYTPDRSRDGPEQWLEGFEGYLQADAYSGYDGIFARGKVTEVGCHAHARRYFFDAKTTDAERACHVLAIYSQLYEVEREAKEQAAQSEVEDKAAYLEEVRLALRQERSVPILQQFHDWLEEQAPKTIPKSPIGQAIGYARSNWRALERYAAHGFLDIDNNASERAMKHVVLGRKNWLFAGSDNGGRTAARIFSLTVTCKRLGVDPFAYLRDMLDLVSTHPASRIEELLPDRWAAARDTATPNSTR
jgi:transposase